MWSRSSAGTLERQGLYCREHRADPFCPRQCRRGSVLPLHFSLTSLDDSDAPTSAPIFRTVPSRSQEPSPKRSPCNRAALVRWETELRLGSCILHERIGSPRLCEKGCSRAIADAPLPTERW